MLFNIYARMSLECQSGIFYVIAGFICIDNKCLDVFIIFRTGLIYGEKKPPAPPQAQHMPIHFAAEAISKPEP